MTDLETIKAKQLDVIQGEDGRTKIVFKKAVLKGKVDRADVLNALMIAARMQVEKYIEKLSRGAPLDKDEIKSMKELSDIIKVELPEVQQVTNNTLTIQSNSTSIDAVKASIYEAIAAKSEETK